MILEGVLLLDFCILFYYRGFQTPNSRAGYPLISYCNPLRAIAHDSSALRRVSYSIAAITMT